MPIAQTIDSHSIGVPKEATADLRHSSPPSNNRSEIKKKGFGSRDYFKHFTLFELQQLK